MKQIFTQGEYDDVFTVYSDVVPTEGDRISYKYGSLGEECYAVKEIKKLYKYDVIKKIINLDLIITIEKI